MTSSVGYAEPVVDDEPWITIGRHREVRWPNTPTRLFVLTRGLGLERREVEFDESAMQYALAVTMAIRYPGINLPRDPLHLAEYRSAG